MGRHYSEDEALQFWLDGHAESLTDGACSEADITPKLQKTWDAFGKAVKQSLKKAAGSRKVEEIYDVEDEESVKSDVYATLTGQGIGIWDGRWDGYFLGAELDVVQRRLKKDLGSWANEYGGGKLEETFHETVSETCEVDNPRRRKTKRKKTRKKTSTRRKKTGKRVNNVRRLVAKALK